MAATEIELGSLQLRLQELARRVVSTLRDEVVAGRGNGIPDKAILENIKNQIKTGTGRIAGALSFEAKNTTRAARQVYTTAQTELAAGLVNNQNPNMILNRAKGYSIEIDEQGRRVARPTAQRATQSQANLNAQARERGGTRMVWVAAYINTCKDCLELSGEIKTLDGWRESGYWPGNGRTVCGDNCKCHLAPVESLSNTLGIEGDEAEREIGIKDQLANGIQLQKFKIKELEELRGKKFTDSEYLNKLGQIRSKTFNPDFKDEESVFISQPF